MYMKCYIGKGIRDGLDNAENRPVRWLSPRRWFDERNEKIGGQKLYCLRFLPEWKSPLQRVGHPKKLYCLNFA